jgi:hypothetical protein
MLASVPGPNSFGHVDLVVDGVELVVPFCEAPLPAFGFSLRFDVPEGKPFLQNHRAEFV